MHCWWKAWPQGRPISSSSLTKFSRHTTHSEHCSMSQGHTDQSQCWWLKTPSGALPADGEPVFPQQRDDTQWQLLLGSMLLQTECVLLSWLHDDCLCLLLLCGGLLRLTGGQSLCSVLSVSECEQSVSSSSPPDPSPPCWPTALNLQVGKALM